MNKYQEAILARTTLDLKTKDNELGSITLKDDTLILGQNENYHLVDYILTISNAALEKIQLDNEIIESSSINISFKDKAKNLTLHFKNNLIDPMKFNLSYQDANKEAYDAKINDAKCKDYIAKASIKCSTGPSLVNIYFQPCDDSCVYTKIKLYTAKGRFEELHGGVCVVRPNWKPRLLGGSIEQLIGNYKVEEGALFKSISGLANGVYGYSVSQYDKNDNKLFETEPMYFVIR